MTELHSNGQRTPLRQGQRQEREEHHLVDRCTANLTLLLITAAGTEVAAAMIVLRRLRSMVGKSVAG